MRITVHDVGHGLCISLVHENGNVMLWDCGHSGDNRPSVFLPNMGIRQIDYFFVTNYDEDHISDLPDLRQNLNIRSLYRNKSITKDQLRTLKRQGGPISPAMESMLKMIGSYTGGPLNPVPEFPGVRYSTHYNNYPDFHDTNNISLVTFLECNGTKFIIPGDLGKPGWSKLLENPSFRNELSNVSVFIASHHGRGNEYCEEVFEYCHPMVIVFSDSHIKYATQKTASKYRSHASGTKFNGETRYVLSTRNDGSFGWNV